MDYGATPIAGGRSATRRSLRAGVDRRGDSDKPSYLGSATAAYRNGSLKIDDDRRLRAVGVTVYVTGLSGP